MKYNDNRGGKLKNHLRQPLKFRQFVVRTAIMLLSLIGSVPLTSQAQQTEVRPPNIIFILTDDQGYGDVGVFFQKQRMKDGKPYLRSPYLDQMATSGAMLTEHYSAAPVCAPSRASLLSGVSQGHANVRDNQFDRALDSNYTMASTLRDLGYSTVAIGKWGLQGTAPYDSDKQRWNSRPTNRGFDRFFGYMRHVDGHEHYPKEAIYFREKRSVEVWDQDQNITPLLDKCYTTDLWTAFAKKWITDHVRGDQKDQPFFMYLAFETPHAVLELPTQAYPEGGGLHGGIQWTGTPGHMINTASGTPDSYVHPDYANATYDDDQDPATKEVPWPDTYKRYAMSNRRIDFSVGDLMALLKDLKIDQNTLVVFTSDNGPSVEDYLPQNFTRVKPTFFESYGPFDGIKRDDWEGGLRMPTIARWPGRIPAGSVVTTPSISYDWASTFLEAAGSVAPERLDGVSLLADLTGKRSANKHHPQRKIIYNEYYFNGKTPDFPEFSANHRNRTRAQMQFIRLEDYVGVRYDIKAASDDFEIYNVVSDPKQTDNLALNPLQTVKITNQPADGNRLTTIADLQNYFKRRVLQVRRAEKWAGRPYDSALVPASPVGTAQLQKGLDWQYYKGSYHWIPQTETLATAAEGHLNAPVLLSSALMLDQRIEAPGIMAMNGYINVPEDGSYTFYLTAGSKSFVRLHDMQLFDADFGYQTGTERKTTVFLKAGLHPMRLFYHVFKRGNNSLKQTNGQLLSLQWEGPGFEKKALTSKDFYSPKSR